MKYQKEFLTDFTRVHNEFLRDKTLSLSARGVLITLLQLPDSWNLSEKTIMSILPDGQKKVSTALKECEKAGYLCRERVVDEKGKVVDMIYHISDQKLPSSVLEKSFRHGVNKVINAVKNFVTPKQSSSNDENPQFKKVNMVEADTGNRSNIITDNTCNNSLCNNPSINPDEIEAEIKQNVGYDYLCDRYDKERVDEIVGIMTGVLTSTADKIRCGKENMCTFSVQNVFKKLNDTHIEYVFESLDNCRTKITNIYNYLVTVLYRSFFTINHHIDSECRLL